MARRSRAEGRSSGDADADAGGPDNAREPIAVHLDDLLADRGMTLTELADQVGITIVNLSVLKNGRARAIRFTTLAGLCRALGCQPGDLLSYEPEGQAHGGSACGATPG